VGVVVVTGCSSGFGRLTAQRFLAEGDTVVATVRRPSDGLAGADVRLLDVTDEAEVQRVVREVVADHGRIDVLVNNAGVGVRGSVEEVPAETVRAAFDANVFGLLHLVRAVLPVMRDQGEGVIVNVGSLAGRVAPPFAGIYAATKFAVEAITESLHYEVAPHGIRVAVVEPGTFPTGLDDRRLTSLPEGSPYASLRATWDAAYGSLPGKADVAPDPLAVADAIVALAKDPQAPLRRTVGSDAELLDGLRRSMDDATFERTVRGALDLWDGFDRYPL
jgi:NAD(P)-dependent dehydrogenase (short-subunit alcohol dehydrogenase family)